MRRYCTFIYSSYLVLLEFFRKIVGLVRRKLIAGETEIRAVQEVAIAAGKEGFR